MVYRWFRKPKSVIPIPLTLVLLLTVACGTAAEPTAEPATPSVATATAPAAATAVPTAMPQATNPPGDGEAGSPAVATPFAEFWNPPVEFYGEPVYGGTLRVIYEDPLEHANSWGASTGSATRFRSATMNNIVSVDPYDNTEIIPDLAQGWTQEADGTGITFYFHDGIKWHNGADFTCEDARFTLQTWITQEGITASPMKGVLNFIDLDNTECVDDLTLKVGFTQPTAYSLLAFSWTVGFIFNKAWFEAGGEEAMFQDVSVGTGAFMWAPGQKVGVDTQHFEKNPNYFKGDGALPYLDEVVIVGILDESAQQAAMLAHQGDWHWVRNFGQYNAYVDHDQIMTVIRPTRGHHSFWMNRRNVPFDNVRVRQAIVMGIDRNSAIEILQEGFGSPGFLMMPGSPWELDEAKGCAVPGWCAPADMEAQRAEARAILEEEGFDFNRTYLFTVESDALVQARTTFIQEQLRLLGVQTEFDLVETVAYRHQTTSGTWGDLLPRNDTMPADDPTLGLSHYFHSRSINNNHWVPAPMDEVQQQMDELLTRSGSAIEPVERKELAEEAQLFAMQRYWKFPIYWEQEAVAFWPEIRGYFHHPGPSGPHIHWEQLWYDPAHKEDRGLRGQTTGVPGGL